MIESGKIFKSLEISVSRLAKSPAREENEAVRGIYLHIPFCRRKCSYCDFYSVTASSDVTAGFLDLLVREMDLFRCRYPEDAQYPADTVYFGGGTPTVLPPEVLCGLLAATRDRFPIEPGAEVTVEANPGTVTAESLRVLAMGGFTRISIGVQSFNPSTLRTLGRIHGMEEVGRTYREARSAGFSSLGIDLIFGIPGQTAEDWEADMDRAIALLPAHVSAYALAPEPGTPLHAAIGRGEAAIPPDEEVAKMYEAARKVLSGAGYRQYEISNFARPGSESRHNRKYWRREGYLGLGPSAHGLIFPPGTVPYGLRTANPPSLAVYRSRIREGHLPWTEERACLPEDAWKESLIFGLRMTEGVDLEEIETRIGAPPEPLRDAVTDMTRTGKLLREGTRLRLPGNLLFVSNEVLALLA
jgi:oxygen-independent coproporphyrinogen-3 oxidase